MEHCQWSFKCKLWCRKLILYNTGNLKSNLLDYNDACILVRVDITVIAPFTKCITKIDGTTIDDAEDLYLIMPMYNLI